MSNLDCMQKRIFYQTRSFISILKTVLLSSSCCCIDPTKFLWTYTYIVMAVRLKLGLAVFNVVIFTSAS